MTEVDGRWDCTVKSPLGDQRMTLTIASAGGRFTGTAAGAMGSAEVAGTLDGTTLAWKQQVTTPIMVTLDVTATVEGDRMTGSVAAGGFGSFPLSGVRAG